MHGAREGWSFDMHGTKHTLNQVAAAVRILFPETGNGTTDDIRLAHSKLRENFRLLVTLFSTDFGMNIDAATNTLLTAANIPDKMIIAVLKATRQENLTMHAVMAMFLFAQAHHINPAFLFAENLRDLLLRGLLTVETRPEEAPAAGSQWPANLFILIGELGLSRKLTDILTQAGGMRYSGEVAQKKERELLLLKNFGRKSLADLRVALAKHGLRTGMTIPDWEELLARKEAAR